MCDKNVYIIVSIVYIYILHILKHIIISLLLCLSEYANKFK